jgi:hypothetical protein
VRDGHLLHTALREAAVPDAARDFVMTTMDVVHMRRPHAIAATFTVGREQAIPGMFLGVIERLRPLSSEPLGTFLAYLERHVSLDGDVHGVLGDRLLAALNGDDAAKWHESIGTAIIALQARRALWDAVSALSTRPPRWCMPEPAPSVLTSFFMHQRTD